MKNVHRKFLNLLCQSQCQRIAVRTMTIGVLLVFGCESADPDPDVVDKNAVFLTFSAKEQTLPTSINGRENIIRMEVGHDADITGLTPEFDIPAGYSVYANGKEQISGSSKVNFSEPVSYEIKDSDNNSASWEVSVVPLGCKILVDASHDGGVWWFPQWEGTGFDPDQPHQGQQFAELLRGKGFDVTELGRSEELTEEMFFGHYIVIRFNGFQGYSARELEVYTKLIDRGMNLVFLTDHKRNEPTDELGNHLGLDFRGIAFGTISTFAPHEITSNMLPLPYIAGSVITNASENPDIEILGWLGETEYGGVSIPMMLWIAMNHLPRPLWASLHTLKAVYFLWEIQMELRDSHTQNAGRGMHL